jgi:hypothetical protein
MKSAIIAVVAVAVLLSVSAFCAENSVMRGSEEGYLVLFWADALYFFCAIAAFILLGKAARLGKLGKKDNATLVALFAGLVALFATLVALSAGLFAVAVLAEGAAFALASGALGATIATLTVFDGPSSYRPAQVLMGISMICMAVATYQAVVL